MESKEVDNVLFPADLSFSKNLSFVFPDLSERTNDFERYVSVCFSDSDTDVLPLEVVFSQVFPFPDRAIGACFSDDDEFVMAMYYLESCAEKRLAFMVNYFSEDCDLPCRPLIRFSGGDNYRYSQWLTKSVVCSSCEVVCKLKKRWCGDCKCVCDYQSILCDVCFDYEQHGEFMRSLIRLLPYYVKTDFPKIVHKSKLARVQDELLQSFCVNCHKFCDMIEYVDSNGACCVGCAQSLHRQCMSSKSNLYEVHSELLDCVSLCNACNAKYPSIPKYGGWHCVFCRHYCVDCKKSYDSNDFCEDDKGAHCSSCYYSNDEDNFCESSYDDDDDDNFCVKCGRMPSVFCSFGSFCDECYYCRVEIMTCVVNGKLVSNSVRLNQDEDGHVVPALRDRFDSYDFDTLRRSEGCYYCGRCGECAC